MQTANLADENYKKLSALFPNAVTETTDENGKIVRAIDKDVLMQEINTFVVEGREERYQFTWPDKRKAILAANAPTTNTLRPYNSSEESVDFNNTENLYIEGDNLEVLKLLQENYLGRVKMIYIDPPYNTGSDLVYEDDFSQSVEEYLAHSTQYDSDGNRLVQNTESNGRFHTDWLNMIYPRIKIARNILANDGVMFISIDDNEVENLQKVCNEIFGRENFVAKFPWRKRTAKSDVPFGISQDFEWSLCYAKSTAFKAGIEGKGRKYYETPDFPGRPWRTHDLTKQTTASERPKSFFTIKDPKTGNEYPANPNATWRITEDTFPQYLAENRIVFPGDYDFLRISKPVLRYWKEDDIRKAGEDFGKVSVSTKFPDEIGMSQDGTREVTEIFDGKIFSFPKPLSLIKFFLTIINDPNALVLDFFSGSATTAHAVMQLNVEDGGKRKFIMVQLPEQTEEKSEAYKAGYKNICEIGKERIRRAAKKIKEEAGSKADGVDLGFRVLKLDTSNMEDVYYTPEKHVQDPSFFGSLFGNIKEGRTGEDLLFQAMLELDVELSSKIETTTIDGKTVYNVADNYLLACFDENVTDKTIEEIAKLQPSYFVMRDSSMANDSVAVNFEQLFKSYSPSTTLKVF